MKPVGSDLTRSLPLFAEDHPDVTFDIIWGSPTREMPPLVAAGVLPHRSWWGVNPHGFANLLRDVGLLMAANRLNREDYTESLFQANTWQGKLLGIPLGVNTTAVFYNKDMFEAAGVNYPSDEMTWDDAISMAQDIVGHFNPSGEIKVWGFNTHTYLPARLALPLWRHDYDGRRPCHRSRGRYRDHPPPA